MSIEIDVLNGSASWARTEPLHNAVFGREIVEKLPWGHIVWAHADLRVLIDAPEGGLACHVGIYFRTIGWNGHDVHVGGIGGVMTREDRRGRGLASIALDAAIATLRANEAVRFAMLFCEPHNFAFYQARGWHPFTGEVYCEQPDGRIRFNVMAPFVFDIRRAPRDGVIDLNGPPF
ncbi:MAG TPA: GNAT family N-acetyltransferase [Bradyrhizobium sp.]|uniref:GNAT family N-acetyltransferase n=1 Tax=Bradyrhizobium sp. TaxID=376 RepID=UPI002BD6F3B6|nr:GNAT family N-acetyltransferase [Bradyrhizobium sp.]HLZ05431.1 GNAT family N-acetyltransferase [Bradyrhizobium sp.]